MKLLCSTNSGESGEVDGDDSSGSWTSKGCQVDVQELEETIVEVWCSEMAYRRRKRLVKASAPSIQTARACAIGGLGWKFLSGSDKRAVGGAGGRRRRGIEGEMREQAGRWGSSMGLLAALEEETRESGGWARVRAVRWAGWMGLSGRLGWASLFPLQLSFLHNFYRIGKKT